MEVGPIHNTEKMSAAGEDVAQEPTEGLRCVIFLLNNLPFDPEDDALGAAQPNLAYRIENLAATYILPLEQILLSSLNAAGFVRAIYVNFGPMGYYELNPNSRPVTPAAFEDLLRELFQAGIIIHSETNEVLWHKITHLSSLMSNLPADSRKIGCLDGAGSQGSTSINLHDYVRNTSDIQSFVFVVGQTANKEIQGYIDDFVKVSEYELVAAYCLSRIIRVMETKWGI